MSRRVLCLCSVVLLALGGCGPGLATADPLPGTDRGPRPRPSQPADPTYPGVIEHTGADPGPADPSHPGDPPGPAVPAPVVLAHGFFGFETFAGVGFVTYFFGVRDALVEAGEPHVYTPAVDPFADSETRGRQLLAHIEAILAETGARRVNLVAHSQGGLDSRVVVSLRPDLVESVTTISTPHQGTLIADIAVGAVPFAGAQAVIDALVKLVAGPLWSASGGATSLFASLEQLSTDGVADLVQRHPLPASVPWYSIAGRSDMSDGGSDCQVASPPIFVSRWDHRRDPIDLLFAVTEPILDGGLFSSNPNDGLVRVADAKHGRFLGCIPADHLDQIGHLLGDRAGLLNDFDHEAFYVELVAWLRRQGH